MRTNARVIGAAAMLLAAGAAAGQTPAIQKEVEAKLAAKRSSLEQAVEEAARNNPDLRVAAAKLALAEAELGAARRSLVAKVAAAVADLDAAEAAAREAGSQAARAKAIRARGAGAEGDVGQAEVALARARAEVAARRAALDYLRGKGAGEAKASRPPIAPQGLAPDDPGVATHVAPAGAGVPEPLRKALRTTLSLKLDDAEAADLLAFLKGRSAVNIHADTKAATWKGKLSCDLKDVSLAGSLQFLEDNFAGQTVVVREYGLLIVPKEKVPPGALTLAAYLADAPGEASEDPLEALKAKLKAAAADLEAATAARAEQERQAGATQDLFRKGKATKDEVARSLVFLARAKAEEASRRAAVEQAKAGLAAAEGRSPAKR